MSATIEATYENGILKLAHPLPIKDRTTVLVTIQTGGDMEEFAERQAWLKLSQDQLTKVWDNPADDVFNELLDR